MQDDSTTTLCACGCGSPIISPDKDGRTIRFRKGHSLKKKGILPASPGDRFWAKVEKSLDPKGCWIWTGGLDSAGYGTFYAGPPALRQRKCAIVHAHIFSYEIHFGPVPDGMNVCHTCDNRPCVRPDHLFPGTDQDNARDMVAKGRWRGGRRKLRWEDAEAIRSEHKAGGVTTVDLARKYGVAQPTISKIIHGITWPKPSRRS